MNLFCVDGSEICEKAFECKFWIFCQISLSIIKLSTYDVRYFILKGIAQNFIKIQMLLG